MVKKIKHLFGIYHGEDVILVDYKWGLTDSYSQQYKDQLLFYSDLLEFDRNVKIKEIQVRNIYFQKNKYQSN